MKSALFRTLTAAVMLPVRWFQIRALEIQIDGMAEVLDCIGDPMLAGRIEIARHMARGELARVRAEYNALLPPGQRRTWRTA